MSAVIKASIEMELSAEGASMLRPDMPPRVAVQALLDAGHAPDALKLLGRMLPKRYAVGWVCQCARDQSLGAEDRSGAALAEKWVREPNESNRRAAYEFANAANYESLGAWLAATAGWAGGSLAPANQETPVPPAEHLTACAVTVAINLLAALEVESLESRRRGFIEQALRLLNDSAATTATP